MIAFASILSVHKFTTIELFISQNNGLAYLYGEYPM